MKRKHLAAERAQPSILKTVLAAITLMGNIKEQKLEISAYHLA